MIYYDITISFDSGAVIVIPYVKEFVYSKEGDAYMVKWEISGSIILNISPAHIVSITGVERFRPFHWLWRTVLSIIRRS